MFIWWDYPEKITENIKFKSDLNRCICDLSGVKKNYFLLHIKPNQLSAMFFISDFVTIINITRIKNHAEKHNVCQSRFVVFFEQCLCLLNEVDSQININFCQLCDC